LKKNNNNKFSKFEKLIEVVQKLRSPDGCDWDKVQTRNSLIPYFIEEVYELIESIDKKDSINIREELGDVLLHVIFQSQIASEKSDFDINDVIHDINKKLIDRHPHVFEKSTLLADKSSNEFWEEQKYKKKGRKSRLDGVPKILPSIIASQRIQEKASSAGFDWEDVSQVWEKLDEEISEVKFAQKLDNFKKIEGELGDLIFTVINLCRFFDVSAENALRKSNKKFIKRFQSLEKKVSNSGRAFEEYSQNELDSIWTEVKKE
jgi:tetrapyrrole methylase family protein/MazG family protein